MKKIITFLMAFGFVLLSTLGWGQVNIINETLRSGSAPLNWTATEIDWETGAGGYAKFSETSSILVTPVVDLTNYTDVVLTFDVAKWGSGTDGPITVEISDDGGSTWVAQTFDSPTPTSSTYVTSGPTAITATGNEVVIRLLRTNSPTAKRVRDFFLQGVLTISPPSITNINQDPATDITSASSVAVSADVAAGDAAIANVELHWNTTNDFGEFTNINMSFDAGDTYETDTDIPAQANGTTVYYRVYAEDVDEESTTSAVQSYTVTDPATTTLPYEEDFSSGVFGDIYTYTVAGTNPWAIASGVAQANGFNGEATEEHWMVLPGIDMDAYADEVMTFTTSAQYGTIDDNNYLKLFYSADYAGIGDPTAATWLELAFDQPAAGPVGTTEIETSSGSIDLSAIAGTNVYLAFKYYSTNSPTNWRVDDILIYEDLLAAEPTNHPTGFSATAISSSEITVAWTDADPAADGYLIKGSDVSYAAIAAPVDGTPEADGGLVKNIAAGVQSHQFSGLNDETTYYFKIFPYNGLETTVNYKTDGAPQDDATTPEGIDFTVVDFDDAGKWTAGSVALGSYASDHTYVDGLFSATGGPALRNGTTAQDGFPGALGTYSWRLRDVTTVEWTITIASGGVGIFEVDVRRWDGSPSPDFDLDYSVNGGNDWVNITTINNASLDESSDWKTFDGTINNPAADIKIRFIANGTTERIFIDNFKWTSFEGEAATNWLADAASSDWNDPANWSSGLPGTASDVVINSSTNDPVLANSFTIQSLVINADAGLSVAPGGNLTVTGTLTNNAGNGGLIVKSDATGTGSLIHNTADVPATIKTYVTGGPIPDTDPQAYRYHLLSIPLVDNILAGDAFMGSYLYTFNPDANGSVEDPYWVGVTDETQVLNVKNGFLGYVSDANHTYSFSGNLFTGDFESLAEIVAVNDFKLIPNPYPSAIDWEEVTKNGINDAIYFFNSATGNYVSYLDGDLPGGTQFIPVGQAFFVEASASNPTVTIPNTARVHSDQAYYKAEQLLSNVLAVKVEANNSDDATYVRFRENASTAFNGKEDASKLRGFGGAPQLFTQGTDQRELSINTMPFSDETTIIPLGFDLGVSSEVNLIFNYMESFDLDVDIFLEDLVENKMINLQEQNTYTFNHNEDNNAMRFNLHFFGVTATAEIAASQDHQIWSHNDRMYIHIPALTGEKVQVELFDLLGHKLYDAVHSLSNPSTLYVPYKGIVIARIVSGDKVYTQKLFIR